MQERLKQATGGARNAGLAVALTLLVAVLGLGAFDGRGEPRGDGDGAGGGTTDEADPAGPPVPVN